MKIKVSIIIAVYKVEKYIRKCVLSCIAQTLKEIEILIINDCTPDNSIEAIKDLINDNDTIILIDHKVNKGHGGALNTGKSKAKGEYIWFIDSDDFIDPNACEFMYNYAKLRELDALGICANNYAFKNGFAVFVGVNKYLYNKFVYGKVFTGRSYFLQAYIKYHRLNTPQWAYLFKKQSIEKFTFRENVAYEDNDGTPIILHQLKRICAIKYAPYYRLIHDTNSTKYMHIQDLNKRKKICSDRLSIIENLIRYVEEDNISQNDTFVYFVLRTFNTEISKQYKELNYGLYDIELQSRFSVITKKIKKIAGFKSEMVYRFIHGYNFPSIYFDRFFSENGFINKVKYLKRMLKKS